LIRLLVTGRFGNQLIQYVAARAQAKRLGVGLEIDLQFCERSPAGDSFSFWLDTLPIHARVIGYPASGMRSANGLLQRGYRNIVRPIFWNRYVQPLWEQDSRFFAIEPWTIISGYFQSLFYLMPRDEEILEELSFSSLATAEIGDYARAISRETSVSVHVRRGDALTNHGDRLPYWQDDHVCYFENAMRLMRSKVARPTFFIFSDDIEWCRQAPIFRTDCEFVRPNQFGENPAIDLLIMSNCRHHIVTNSTYSWWAAWITIDDDKICILPNKWTPSDTTAKLGLVHPNWITL
jgi:hypothetical protein